MAGEEDAAPAARFLVPVVVWLVLCLIADAGSGFGALAVVAGALTRAVLTFLIAAAVRALYVRRRPGRTLAPETFWFAAALAGLLAAGRLS